VEWRFSCMVSTGSETVSSALALSLLDYYCSAHTFTVSPLVQATHVLGTPPEPAPSPDNLRAIIASVDVVGPHSLTPAPPHVFMRQHHRPDSRGSG
jgi:hypothetical protein